jgi:hypothetical protein
MAEIAAAMKKSFFMLHSCNENDVGEFIPVWVIRTDTRRSFMEQMQTDRKTLPFMES